jgi:hypothetical protein
VPRSTTLPPSPYLEAGSPSQRWITGAAASAAWFAVAVPAKLWTDRPEGDWEYTGDFAVILAAIGAALAGATVAGWWIGAPLPFFPPPQAILKVFVDD